MKSDRKPMKAVANTAQATASETEMAEEEVEGLLDVAYVASKLKVCKATVYKMVKEGKIEAVHLNRLVRITPK